MTNRRNIPVGVTIEPSHWALFKLLHKNASSRVRALVLLDLKLARKKGKLDALLAMHDNDPRVKKLIEELPE